MIRLIEKHPARLASHVEQQCEEHTEELVSKLVKMSPRQATCIYVNIIYTHIRSLTTLLGTSYLYQIGPFAVRYAQIPRDRFNKEKMFHFVDGLKSADCGDWLSTVRPVSCSRNQFETI